MQSIGTSFAVAYLSATITVERLVKVQPTMNTTNPGLIYILKGSDRQGTADEIINIPSKT